ncbi:MAG: hypothetical protein KJ042_12680, partial [Deltaproteobacteria bacterium]|nr:hypothetical protein [Deltaproteobacteria bacterium]
MRFITVDSIKTYFSGLIDDMNLPDRRNLMADLLVMFTFLTFRAIFFQKFLISTLYGPEVGCEIQMYSQVATDLATGKYFTPIIHGYGIPFMFHYLIGILAGLTGNPIAATGQFQFYMDCFVVPATYVFGCMFRGRRTGLIAALLVCLSPIYTTYAMIITVASSVFHVYGYVFLFHAVKRCSRVSSVIAGILFGMPDGGGRFSPFIVAAGLAAIVLLIEDRKYRYRLSKWLIAGWVVSLSPMIAYGIKQPLYLLSLFFAFTSRGFAHVVMSRGFLDGIFSKIVESTPNFF